METSSIRILRVTIDLLKIYVIYFHIKLGDVTYYCSSYFVIYLFPGIMKNLEGNSGCTFRLLSKINSSVNAHLEFYNHIYFKIGLPSTKIVFLSVGF